MERASGDECQCGEIGDERHQEGGHFQQLARQTPIVAGWLAWKAALTEAKAGLVSHDVGLGGHDLSSSFYGGSSVAEK